MTTPTTVQVRMQLRADTAANWTSINPTLLSAEIGLERDTNKIKIGNGTTAWNSLGYFPFVVSGGVVTGNLEIGTTGTLTFEGSTADGFETTLAVVNPTADRTITLPNVTGTVITTGDTGTVTSTMIADGTIVNADVNASAAIAHSKLASMTAGFVLIGNASNVPTATALSGDVTVSSSGVTAIGSGVVVDADISATAEIAVSKLADGAARQLLQTDAAGTGVEWTDNVDVPGTLDVTGAATFDNNVTIQGDLTVNGTTTTIDTQNLVVEAKNVVIGNVTSPTDVTADGGGITLKGTTDKTISWSDTTNAWTSSEPLDLPAGSSGAPSLFFGGDVNSGLYSPGADQVAISTGGTGRMFIDSSGRVGIKTDSPSQSLHVYDGAIQAQAGTGNTNTDISLIRAVAGPTGGAVFNIRAADGANDNSDWLITTNANESLRFNVGGSERLRITSDGNVGVGVASPVTTLHLQKATGGLAGVQISTSTHGSTGTDGLFVGIDNSLGYLWNYENLPLVFGTNSTERARLDASGRLLVGTSSSRSGWFNSASWGNPRLQVEGTSVFSSIISVVNNSNDDTYSSLILGKSRATSVGGVTAVSSGDEIGRISFQGADGTELVAGAYISAVVDGTPGANDLPTRLVLSTTADGASSPTERMRITSAGFLGCSNTGTVPTTDYNTFTTNATNWTLALANNHASGPYGLFIDYSANPDGTSNQFLHCRAAGSIKASIRSNGGLANYSANNVNLSDRNAKKDIAPAADTWDCLKEWEIVNFRYKDQPDDTDLNMGVIAQQVAESCPEVITVFQEATDDEPAKLGVKDQQMMWMAIKALQEAQLRIETLEAEVAALKGA